MPRPLPALSRKTRTLSASEVGVFPDRHTSRLSHDLVPVLPELAAIRRRRSLVRSPAYRRHRDEIDRVLAGFEWSLTERTPGPPTLRAVAWNIERGKHLRGVANLLASHPDLKDADLILLTEVDIGMGRSGNVNVASELARVLGMDYVYGNMELLLSPGDAFERAHGQPNTLALHGCALLTRLPVRRFHGVRLPEFRDKFHAYEKRLGGKRALLCEVLLEDGPLTVVIPHLDPFAPPRHRAHQMRLLLREVERFGPDRVLLGGDLNTNTYSLGTRAGLAANVLYKLGLVGFDETIRHYMTPDRKFERGVFRALRGHGYEIDAFNDRSQGTCFYDIHDAELADWTRTYVPSVVWRWLRRKLEPWQGRVPLRLDWMAGRGIGAATAGVVPAPRLVGVPVSDHNPIWVRLCPAPPAPRNAARHHLAGTGRGE